MHVPEGSATPRDGVAVVGSYGEGVWIRAPRMPSRGETVIGSGFTTGPGGKGSNQAVGIARLGVSVSLLTCIGADGFGRGARSLWDSEGVEAGSVVEREGVPTMVGVIVIDESGENRIVIDPGALNTMTAGDVDSFLAVMRSRRVLLTQCEVPLECTIRALQAGRDSGMTTILNPAPARVLPESIYSAIDILTPNQSEARVLLGLSPDDPSSDEGVANQLWERGVGAVVLTRGGDGALTITGDGIAEYSAPPVEVVDTTGAGDAFNACLAASLAEGRDLNEAVRRATHAGSMAVTVSGVIPALPMKAELDRQSDTDLMGD